MYRADRKVVWEAEVIGKTEELNVADFMEDRDRRINKALTDRHKKPGSDREAE